MSSTNNIQLNESVGVFEIKTPEEFADLLKFKKAILYLQVDWSGPEHMARGLVYNLLNELKIDTLTSNTTPFFKLDCSDDLPAFIKNWFDAQSPRRNVYSHGYGELLLVQNGTIIQLIENPTSYGKEKIHGELVLWLNKKS